MFNDTATHFYFNWTPAASGTFYYQIFFNDTEDNWNSALINFNILPIKDGINWLIIIFVVIAGIVAAAFILRTRTKSHVTTSSLVKTTSFEFRDEMARKGIGSEELDKILSSIFKELTGKTQMRIKRR